MTGKMSELADFFFPLGLTGVMVASLMIINSTPSIGFQQNILSFNARTEALSVQNPQQKISVHQKISTKVYAGHGFRPHAPKLTKEMPYKLPSKAISGGRELNTLIVPVSVGIAGDTLQLGKTPMQQQFQ
jgi:hypothetical protein